MQLDELLIKVRQLPALRQREVMDFVLFLEQQCRASKPNLHSDWSDQAFNEMSVDQAMRGLENEPEIYAESDLKERWQ
jgi:cytochrome c